MLQIKISYTAANTQSLNLSSNYSHFLFGILVIPTVFMCVCKKSAFVLPGHFQLQFDGSQLCDVHQHHLRPCHKEVCACTRYRANQQPAQTLCFRHLKQRMPLVKDTHRKFFFLYTNSKTNTEWKEITAQRNTGHCNGKIPKRTKKMKYSNFLNKDMQQVFTLLYTCRHVRLPLSQSCGECVGGRPSPLHPMTDYHPIQSSL